MQRSDLAGTGRDSRVLQVDHLCQPKLDNELAGYALDEQGGRQ